MFQNWKEKSKLRNDKLFFLLLDWTSLKLVETAKDLFKLAIVLASVKETKDQIIEYHTW